MKDRVIAHNRLSEMIPRCLVAQSESPKLLARLPAVEAQKHQFTQVVPGLTY